MGIFYICILIITCFILRYLYLRLNKYKGYQTIRGYDELLADLNKQLEINPNSVEALNTRGLTYFNMGEYEKSLEDLNKSLEINPNSAELIKFRGVVYFTIGKYEESLKDLSEFLETNPNSADVLSFRGLTYIKLERYEESLVDLSKSLEIDPNLDEGLRNRAHCYFIMGRYEESLVDINNSLEINPNSATALSFRGQIYFKLGRYKKLFQDLSKSLEIKPNFEGALNIQGIAHRNMGNYKESLENLNNLLEINPNSAEALSNRGMTYHNMGRYEESLVDLNKSLEINPNSVETLNNRGLTYQSMGKYEESLKDLNKALQINPNFVESLNNRGVTYQCMGKYEKSLEDLNKLLKISPNFMKALNNRGVTYQSMGRYEESLVDLNKSLEIDPNSEEVLSNRGLTYYKIKRYEESLADLNKSLEINPNSVEALNNRGLTYQRMGRYEESLVDFNKSLEINPNSAVVLNNRGFTYQSMSKYKESLVDFNKSLEIDPNYEPALVNRGLVYQEMGRYEESYVDLNESLIKSHRTNMQNTSGATSLRFGTCTNCKQYNSGIDFCHLCDSQINQEWTSGNMNIDEFIKHAQMNTPYYHKVIEWIPFDRLENIQEIGKGGFSTIYSATWIDGKRAYSWNETKGKLIKAREKFCKVALKSLTGTQNISLDFLNEFKAQYECQLEKLSVEKYGIETYGITYNTNRKEYMMVFEHADKGDLRHYLSENFASLTWKQKLKLLYSISDNLDYIHQRYVHKDFHSGNILIVSTGSFNLNALLYSTYKVNNKAIMITQDIGKKSNIEPKISDLGLSSRIDEINVDGGTYGVVQYVADEVLLGQPYTKASDVYSLGVIMAEVSTGKPPFENLSRKTVQIQKVLNRLRPEFAKGTPECYVKLANQCMDSDPTKRPTAKEVCEKLREWKIILDKGTKVLNDELKIKNEFLKADKMIVSQLEALQRHPDAKYKSQLEEDEIISLQFETPQRDPYASQLILNLF